MHWFTYHFQHLLCIYVEFFRTFFIVFTWIDYKTGLLAPSFPPHTDPEGGIFHLWCLFPHP